MRNASCDGSWFATIIIMLSGCCQACYEGLCDDVNSASESSNKHCGDAICTSPENAVVHASDPDCRRVLRFCWSPQ